MNQGKYNKQIRLSGSMGVLNALLEPQYYAGPKFDFRVPALLIIRYEAKIWNALICRTFVIG